MAFQLGKRSRKRLARIHPDLRRVVERAIQLSDVDFTVMEGVRTLEKQKRLVEQGASRTLESRHLTGMPLTSVLGWIVKFVGTLVSI